MVQPKAASSVSSASVLASWPARSLPLLGALLLAGALLAVATTNGGGSSSERIVGIRKKEEQTVFTDSFCKGTKWAVMTTILEVNRAVEHIASKFSNDTCLLVVGDLKMDHGQWEAFEHGHAHTRNVIYLSPDAQKELPFEVVKHTPWNHFGRKSIGFMYAIANGAELIYDFDDDNHLNVNSFEELFFHHDPLMHAIDTSHHVFNPYPCFESVAKGKAVHVWPRGFPLQFINDKAAYSADKIIAATKKLVDVDGLAVVQSLANHDPDVDAIYRMTQQLPVTFQRKKTILQQQPGTFVPFNAQATLFRPAAFFGLLLPVTVTGRVSDIWRSYITQRLLWETKHRVAFTSSFVSQYRNPHSYMKDFEDEKDLYYNVDHLLMLLAGWTSDKFDTMDEAYLDLVTLLVNEGIFSASELRLAKAWVMDMKAVGYRWPRLSNRQEAFVPRTAAIVDQRQFGQG
jgi:hypothetical protein